MTAAEAGAEAAEEAAAQQEIVDSFPESYSEQTEKVKFDCQLEVPEDFSAAEFRIPEVKGYATIDPEAIYEKYVEGQTVVEQYLDQPSESNERGDDAYILEDGTLIGITEGFLYNGPESSVYRNVTRSSEEGASRDTFAFASAEDCIQEVKEKLEEIGCPTEEYQFEWFSVSGEEYQAMEQQALEKEELDSRNVNPNGWSEANNAYEIYAWQIYEGLQVFPQLMTTNMRYAFENYTKVSLSAVYTEQGLQCLVLTKPPFLLEPAGEAPGFLAFSEIADVLFRKYEDMLDEEVYTVTRAKLALRTYLDEKQQLGAEPVWYFEVSDGSSEEVVLVNAVTGEEIFLR